MHNGILLSCKKEQDSAIYSNMDGTRDSHTEWNEQDKEKYHMISPITGI